MRLILALLPILAFPLKKGGGKKNKKVIMAFCVSRGSPWESCIVRQ